MGRFNSAGRPFAREPFQLKVFAKLRRIETIETHCPAVKYGLIGIRKSNDQNGWLLSLRIGENGSGEFEMLANTVSKKGSIGSSKIYKCTNCV